MSQKFPFFRDRKLAMVSGTDKKLFVMQKFIPSKNNKENMFVSNFADYVMHTNQKCPNVAMKWELIGAKGKKRFQKIFRTRHVVN